MTSHKIANKGHEDESRFTTRSYSRHGLSKTARRVKGARNRAAKIADRRAALRDGRDA